MIQNVRHVLKLLYNVLHADPDYFKTLLQENVELYVLTHFTLFRQLLLNVQDALHLVLNVLLREFVLIAIQDFSNSILLVLINVLSKVFMVILQPENVLFAMKNVEIALEIPTPNVSHVSKVISFHRPPVM